GVEVTISKSKNEDAMNMAEDGNFDQFDDQVNELLAQTLESEDNIENIFEQRNQQKKAQQEQSQRQRKQANIRTVIVKFEDLEQVINYAYHN
ncbi:adaptor protein MecA, partial [Staphylococcus epidermidis]